MTSAIVLAGGLGTRLRNEVRNLPKPMAPILNKPFLEHLLDYWIDQGIDHIHLSVGYMHEKIKNHFGNLYCDVPVTYSIEEVPLGTGGGLRLCIDQIDKDENFLLINGDTFFPVPLDELNKKHFTNNSSATLCLFNFNESDRYSEIIFDHNSNITGILSKNESSKGFANGGVYMFNSSDLKKCFNFLPNKNLSLEDDIIPSLISKKFIVKAIIYKLPFIDIGVPKDYRLAPDFFKNMRY